MAKRNVHVILTAWEAEVIAAGVATQLRVPEMDYSCRPPKRSEAARLSAGELIWAAEPFTEYRHRTDLGQSFIVPGGATSPRPKDLRTVHCGGLETRLRDFRTSVRSADRMVRVQSRITLEVTGISSAFLSEISELDALASGIVAFGDAGQFAAYGDKGGFTAAQHAADAFIVQWRQTHMGVHERNPHLVVIHFKPHLENIDVLIAKATAAEPATC